MILGQELPAGNDLILFCVPHNAIGWNGRAGYAVMGGWKSVYRNNYCLNQGTVMHELGHNLGFGHGGKQPDGWMGGSCGKTQLYNAPDSFRLGWYEGQDRHKVIFPLDELYWEGDIIGFADYQLNTTGPPVVVQIQGNATNDWYVSFNRIKGINWGHCLEDQLVKIHYKKHPVTQMGITYGLDLAIKDGETRVENTWDTRPLNIVVKSINNTTEPWSANIKIFATCFSDDDCDNGEPCDGEERCGGDGACMEGTPIFCEAPTTAPTKFCLDSPVEELENSGKISGGSYSPYPITGVVFDVQANDDVFVDAMSPTLKKDQYYNVTIYTKAGSFVGYDNSISEWTGLVDGVVVQNEEISFEPVFIDGGTTQSFFIFVERIAESGALTVLKHDVNLGDVVVSGKHMHILGGIRKDGLFGSDTKGGVFSMSGFLHYHACGEKPSVSPSISMIPSSSHAPSESFVPTFRPSVSLLPSESLLPSTLPTYVCYGNPLLTLLSNGNGKSISSPVSSVFDIEVMKSLYIETLYLKLKDGVDHVVSVYKKQGSYVGHESNGSVWTKIVDEMVMTRGDIPSDNFPPFYVAEGSTLSFYVHVTSQDSGSVALTKGSTTVGEENSADEALSVKYGLRVNDAEAFGTDISGSPYALKGEIRYRLCEIDAPVTAAPAPANPMTAPSLVPTKISSFSPSLVPTKVFSTSPSTAVVCEGLKKAKCNEKNGCAFGAKKLKVGKCVSKKKDCFKYSEEKCKKNEKCKYQDSACKSKCDGLNNNKKKCKNMKVNTKTVCKYKPDSNPCWRCHPKTCS